MLVEVGKAEGRQPGQIIKEAIAEYERSGRDIEANSKLIDAIAANDLDRKFQISENAFNMLTE